jgi:hypothetical protein
VKINSIEFQAESKNIKIEVIVARTHPPESFFSLNVLVTFFASQSLGTTT